ncbi:TetR/AcrR family transcriptional regulator [Gordonia terrae]|uniref:TetR family transcriptional regulator n=2 Tax=Gordonia terrae TaxID=2055 RepID=A0AAD0KG27_9ACTN|nr:TetR family transcriptional regulator [Gordonia terrae]VTR07820.1 transcriptional regulator BetI [Clostridioides difficile]ANY24986.1 TetR family transcriptional regulator [Gordonia terrae]AWO85736.1 TetR family transcriptional regulator [Gordonia terrae]VTS61160.1 transcriptional regulator BetI [Gordonia terrae]GAB44447.1 putative TetR family transcriptional regulator [Gordonia terrae NBRC 100016]
MTEAPVRRRRNPEERRRIIVEAAATLITEVGSDGLTHRLVAKRAGVPLGSTTQYFATLDDLREAALAHLADDIDSGLADVAETLGEHGPSAAVFAEALHEYLSDERLIRADLALVSAAVIDPSLRPLAIRWTDGLVETLIPHVGRTAARAIAAYTDGVAMHALLYGSPLSIDDLTATLTALTALPSTPSTTDQNRSRR